MMMMIMMMIMIIMMINKSYLTPNEYPHLILSKNFPTVELMLSSKAKIVV